MLDTFDGNYMLATAAYNAGPGRAKRWAAERECLPADLWVELIPFTETRTYVKRVLFFTAVFESLLGQQSTSLKVELGATENCPGAANDQYANENQGENFTAAAGDTN
jgi:soluble lytic murein transglycosylase